VRGPIRAGGAESADIPHSDRERGEGFQRSGSSAVVVSSAGAVTRSERDEGVQLTGSPAVASSFVVEKTASERVED